MNHYIQITKDYVLAHKREFALGILAAIVAAFLIGLFIYNNPQKIVYQPADACKLFTPAEAQSMLGDKVIDVNTKKPILEGNTSTSKCSYTDSNPERAKMKVAAVAVRSGVNDQGVAQNKKDFATAKSSKAVQAVKELGESAYFNPERGQLNVLKGRDWIILSYGYGDSPEANTLEQTTELAHKVLQ